MEGRIYALWLMVPGNGEFCLVADIRFNWLLSFNNRGPVVLDLYNFSGEPGNLDLYMKSPNFNMLAPYFFLKVWQDSHLNTSWGRIWSFWNLFFFPKKFLNSSLSFLSEDRKVLGHLPATLWRLEYRVTARLGLGWRSFLFNNRHYSRCWSYSCK